MRNSRKSNAIVILSADVPRFHRFAARYQWSEETRGQVTRVGPVISGKGEATARVTDTSGADEGTVYQISTDVNPLSGEGY